MHYYSSLNRRGPAVYVQTVPYLRRFEPGFPSRNAVFSPGSLSGLLWRQGLNLGDVLVESRPSYCQLIVNVFRGFP
jgi:hypothetical protein